MIQQLNATALTEESKKLKKRFGLFNQLIEEINKKDIPKESLHLISEMIKELQSNPKSAKLYAINIRRTQTKILRMLQKEHKIVPKNQFRNMWMAIGMSAFGVPMGVAFGASLQNMAFIGIGIPVGMIIGMAIGAGMDKKAEQEGRQLNIQIEI